MVTGGEYDLTVEVPPGLERRLLTYTSQSIIEYFNFRKISMFLPTYTGKAQNNGNLLSGFSSFFTPQKCK
jgi:hypothetical protein